jgi:hypothetical protein
MFAARSGSLGLGRRLLAGRAFQLFAFQFVFNLGGIGHVVPLSFKTHEISRKSGRCEVYVNREEAAAKAANARRERI